MVGSVPPSSMRSMSSSVIAAQGQFGDGPAEGGADVVQGLPERQGLADRDPFGIVGQVLGARPVSVVAGHLIPASAPGAPAAAGVTIAG
jgi:hypothetical protein